MISFMSLFIQWLQIKVYIEVKFHLRNNKILLKEIEKLSHIILSLTMSYQNWLNDQMWFWLSCSDWLNEQTF